MIPNESSSVRIEEFGRLVAALHSARIPFLLVGGLSLSAHHIERTTHDVDFFCCRSFLAQFDSVMKQLGYECDGEPTELYVRYSQPGRSIVDFIFANEETFAQMEASSETAVVLQVQVRVPCLEHLLAMKLFALEQGKRLKDMADISELLLANGMDANGPEFERLCRRFASEKWLNFFRGVQ